MELNDRLKYAKRALDGIALGDCFGQTFFAPDEIACQRIKDREILNAPWHFTDDTVMAIGIYCVLEKYGKIDQDELAKVFAENYALDWHRGYGGTAHAILRSTVMRLIHISPNKSNYAQILGLHYIYNINPH